MRFTTSSTEDSKNTALQRKLLVYALKTHTPLSLREIAKELGERLTEPAICQIKKRFVEEDARQGYIHIKQLNKMLNVKTWSSPDLMDTWFS